MTPMPPALRGAALKAAVVLVPSYAAAYLTGQMVYVIPTLAAASFFAAAIETGDAALRQEEDDSGAPDVPGAPDGPGAPNDSGATDAAG